LLAHNRGGPRRCEGGWGEGGLPDAQPVGGHLQRGRAGAKADASGCKEGEGQLHPLRLEGGGPGLFLAQVLLGLFEGLFGVISLLANTLECFSQVAIVLSPFFGLVFPLMAALSEFGLLAHQVPPGQSLSPRRWTHGIRMPRIAELRWTCITKANWDRGRNEHLVTRPKFWARQSSLFGHFWTPYS